MDVPAADAVTEPVEPMVIATLLLLHVPPVVASLNDIGNWGHFVATPDMPGMETITFTDAVVEQPVGKV